MVNKDIDKKRNSAASNTRRQNSAEAAYRGHPGQVPELEESK